MKNEEPFAFAGIWDTWSNKETGEVVNSFSIITAGPNTLTQNIPHHRSHVVLQKEDEKKWLDNDLPLQDVLGLLKPYPGDLMKAYPISIKIKNPKNHGQELILPIGPEVTAGYDIKVSRDVRLERMGSNKRKGTPPEWQGKLF